MAKLQHAVREVARLVPGAQASYNGLRFLWWRERIRRRSRVTMQGAIDPHRTLTVDPSDIRLACVWGPERYRKFEDRGQVLGGSWDTQVEEFESLDVYRGFREHFVEGKPWRETDYYQRVLGQVLGGYHKRGMTSSEDVDARCAELDRLYRQIGEDGYKPLSMMRARPLPWTGYEDEVSIRIGRDGDLLFEDGRHRLAIAKLLGVERIPVKVTVRHSQWFSFVREVREFARNQGGKIHETISHPDLDDVPARHGGDRFDLIKNHLPFSGGTALDIGCHWGYRCQRLEDMGFSCVGIEPDPRDFYFAQKLRRAESKTFDLLNGSIFEHPDLSRFDLVLALGSFQQFTKTADLHRKLVELLGRLEMRALVLGYRHDEPATTTAFRRYSSEQFIEVILRHSSLTRVSLIGPEQGRWTLYLLEA